MVHRKTMNCKLETFRMFNVERTLLRRQEVVPVGRLKRWGKKVLQGVEGSSLSAAVRGFVDYEYLPLAYEIHTRNNMSWLISLTS